MNNAITEIKSTLEGTNSRITEAEYRISEVEDIMLEINEAARKNLNPRRGLTLLSPVCRDPAIGV